MRLVFRIHSRSSTGTMLRFYYDQIIRTNLNNLNPYLGIERCRNIFKLSQKLYFNFTGKCNHNECVLCGSLTVLLFRECCATGTSRYLSAHGPHADDSLAVLHDEHVAFRRPGTALKEVLTGQYSGHFCAHIQQNVVDLLHVLLVNDWLCLRNTW